MKRHLKEQCFKLIGYPEWFKRKQIQVPSHNRFTGSVNDSFAGILGGSPLDIATE